MYALGVSKAATERVCVLFLNAAHQKQYKGTLFLMIRGAGVMRTNAPPKLPEFTGVAHRCSAHVAITSHKGEFVAIVVKPDVIDNTTFVLRGKDTDDANTPIAISSVPPTIEVSNITEFFCYVDPATSALVYHSHGQLNDDFDIEMYNELVKLIQSKRTQIF